MGSLVESLTKQVTIETPRFNMRPLQREDAPALAQLGTDEVFELVPEIETPFDAREWVERKLENEQPAICHVVLLRETGVPIGYVQAGIIAGKTNYEFEHLIGAQDDDGQPSVAEKKVFGVAFHQSDISNQKRIITCHGPRSVYGLLIDAVREKWPE